MTISNISIQSTLMTSEMSVDPEINASMNIRVNAELAEGASGSELDFITLLGQNLTQIMQQKDGQVIDNTELMSIISELEAGLAANPGEGLPSEWMQYLKSHFSEIMGSAQTDQLVLEENIEQADPVELLLGEVEKIEPEQVLNTTEPLEDKSETEVDAVAVMSPVVIDEGKALPPLRQAISAAAVEFTKLDKSQISQKVVEAVPLSEGDIEKLDSAQKLIQTTEDPRQGSKSQNTLDISSIKPQPQQPDPGMIKLSENSTFAVQSTPAMSAAQNIITTHSQPLSTDMQSLSLPATANSQQWGSALGEKVAFLINQNMNKAEIRIDPPHLGKLDISIHLKDDSATVVIHTQHAHTRDLVENSSIRLREYLQEAGYSSVDVNVSHRESSSEQNFAGNQQSDSVTGKADAMEGSMISEAGIHQASISMDMGRIDYFA